MKNILISADGGLRWSDMDVPRGRFFNVAVMAGRAGLTRVVDDLPMGPVTVQHRCYECVGGGDGFNVWRETIR